MDSALLDRTLALAGIYQAAALVNSIAQQGRAESQAMHASLGSLFHIDCAQAADIFGGTCGVREGLARIVEQLDSDTKARDAEICRYAVSLIHLERRLAGQHGIQQRLREDILATQRQADHLGVNHAAVAARIAEVYSHTVGALGPRIMVRGNPLFLTQEAWVNQVRSLLLAGVRAAVLWRQLGGSRWNLLWNRRDYVRAARELLARIHSSN
jgi:high frequency lysogenization protein